MVKVLVVLADVLLNLEAGRKVRYALHRPRFDVRAWIIDGRFDFQMAQIGTTVPFNQVQPGRHRLTTRAQPSLVIETDCVDDQRVSVPMADRMPVPCWVEILRMGTTVEEHLPVSRYLL